MEIKKVLLRRVPVIFHPLVFRLGLVSLLADISSEMLYPITPIFLTTVLGASMTSVGFIEGAAEAIASLLKVYTGAWSDRLQRRKPFVWIGYLLAALAKPLTGFATSWWGVFAARGLDRVGKGLRNAPRDALLADAVDAKVRGAVFGWHRAMVTGIATVIASTVAGALWDHVNPTASFIFGVVGAIFSILILFYVRLPRASFDS